MKNDLLRVFLGGDIFGPVGLRCATALLPSFIESEKIDFTVINGENASSGIGISAEDAQAVFAAGADVITGGNHSFEKRDFWPVLDSMDRLLRPANFPPDAGLPGQGYVEVSKNGITFAVLNLQGREDMQAIDCPFRLADSLLPPSAQDCPGKIAFVDFHAESNQEKEAMGLHLAGRATAVVGTHTHVQTADERILEGGTAYMTDLGMTGPLSSVIGSDPDLAIKRNITQVLYRMENRDSRGALRGLVVDVSPETGKALSVTRVCLAEPERTQP
jgi:2',3'-cyclic-nucleotide 2'-phosphodiesterase